MGVSQAASAPSPERRRCWFCGVELTSRAELPTQRTREHLVPRHATRGESDPRDLPRTCRSCNCGLRGPLHLEDFRAILRELFPSWNGRFHGEDGEGPKIFAPVEAARLPPEHRLEALRLAVSDLDPDVRGPVVEALLREMLHLLTRSGHAVPEWLRSALAGGAPANPPVRDFRERRPASA